MADALSIGRPFRMVVEEGKSREFARATAPLSWSGPPADSDLSPVTFLASSRFWLDPADSAWAGVERDYRRVLHGEQEFTFTDGPPPVGTTLTGLERIDREYTKSGSRGEMRFTETVIDFSREGDPAPVASTRATSITLPTVATSDPPGGAGGAPGPPWTAPPDHRLVTDLSDRAFTLTDFVRYQGASGDFNPIHHDQDFAAAGGYPSPFAVGMLTAGIVGTLVTSQEDPARLRRFACRWKAQAWPGDRLRYRVFVLPDSAEGRHRYVDVSRPDGRTHVQAWADFA